jgi:hypothetical protein
MHEVRGFVLIVGGLLALAGCSETGFQDSLGVGKTAPDESQVRINQALSIPPDLRLAAPSSKTVEPGTPNKVATYQSQPVTYAPVEADTYVAEEPSTTASTAPAEPAKTAEAAATATTTATTITPAEPEKPKTLDDSYAKYGISKTYANGKPKPEGVLIDELRKAQTAEKRAKDPSYGTIWNMGDVFSDD